MTSTKGGITTGGSTSSGGTGDPSINVGMISTNDCRTVCRALKLRAAEITKVAKKCKELDRHNEAKQLEGEAADIIARLGPKFDEQGTFNFGAGPNEKKGKDPKQGSLFGKRRGRSGKRAPRDLAEEAHDRLQRGGR